jgi:O-methyltransferase involved in polyketide biosynthesis
VVEIGAGLNTRFERLDNSRVHWFHLDLPEAVRLRRGFFTDTGRRTTLAGSVLKPNWMAVRQAALSQIVRNFPPASPSTPPAVRP